MACFIVPAAGAIVSHLITRKVKKHESQSQNPIPFSTKLGWLTRLLGGGSILLAFEHIWHGEVVPWFPFLTAAVNPEDRSEMFFEMATVGVTMLLLCTAIWGIMLAIVHHHEKNAISAEVIQ